VSSNYVWNKLVADFPPLCRLRGFGVWFFDERWRLPYRWWEFQRFPKSGFALMLGGAAVMVAALPDPHKEPK